MTLLEEIHERRKRFHAQIARKALVLNPPKPVEVSTVPKEPEKKVISIVEQIKAERAWSVVVCGSAVKDGDDMPVVYPIKITDIQDIVARAYGITRLDILASRRTWDHVRPRQIAMYLAKNLTTRSLPEIGRRFGGRDHTTVLHAVRRITQMMAMDPDFASEVNTVKALFI